MITCGLNKTQYQYELLIHNAMLCYCWYFAIFTSVVIYVQEEMMGKHVKELQALEVCPLISTHMNIWFCTLKLHTYAVIVHL